VDGSEIITVDGEPIQTLDEVKVWIFYKPAGLVTTHKDEQGRETVFEYLKEHGLEERVISVGRLDLNSEGLLLLTNNGEYARFAESPQTEWKRIYRVRVYGDASRLDVEQLQQGITIDGVNYREVIVEFEKDFAQKGQNAWLQVSLTEGKNREIRKIMEHFGLKVNRLIRISYGPYTLGNLKVGEVRQEQVVKK
jgi:23S rRNA pseudouridine2605 synthase